MRKKSTTSDLAVPVHALRSEWQAADRLKSASMTDA
jgi:hypothetical protein